MLGEVVEELGVAVDGRVLVALTRGLWELSAREIFEYLEGLQGGAPDTKVPPTVNSLRSSKRLFLRLRTAPEVMGFMVMDGGYSAVRVKTASSGVLYNLRRLQ